MVIATSMARPVAAAISATTSRIICRGTGLIAGLARRDLQARPGDGADALAGMEGDAAARRPAPDGGAHQAAMRHVGIVARILDDGGRGGIAIERPLRQGEARLPATRQPDGDRIGEAQPDQGTEGGLHRRRGAGARWSSRGAASRGGASAVIGDCRRRPDA